MSVTDPVTVEYLPKRKSWILKRGRETFYDDNDYMREWDTAEEAAQWARDELGVKVIRDLGPLFEGGLR